MHLSRRDPSPVALLFHDVFSSDASESGFSSPAADRYKLTIAAFEAQLASLARVERTAMMAPHMTSGSVAESAVVLTFDDGGVSYYTVVADRLETHGWRGHCFVTTGAIGQRGFLSRSQIRELDGRGHLIGTHSVTHPTRFSACSRRQMELEWRDSRRMLEDILGHDVTIASLPGGYFSTGAASAAAKARLGVLFISQPTTTIRRIEGCAVVGRFTIRRGSPTGLAAQLVARAPWARWAAWSDWTAKGLIKPLLGSTYPRLTNWVLRSVR
jgi:peptidoglycan/xylan/chitin deacetylase (PgdA/CDA1 family)